MVIGSTSEPERVPASVLSSFKHELAFEAPDEAERHEILDCLLSRSQLAPDVSLSNLAIQTAGLVASDLVALASRANSTSISRMVRAT